MDFQKEVSDDTLYNQVDSSCASTEDNLVVRDMFDKALSNLKPIDRKIAHRVFVCGYSSEDVGRELEMPNSTVRGRLRRIKEELGWAGVFKQKVEEWEHELTRNNS